MTTPPQGPWGPGQPGGQPGGQHGGQGGPQPPQQGGGWGQQPPGQGGWGQRPQQPQQPSQQPPQQGQPAQQPQQGQPPRQGQPPQQGGGWGQQPGRQQDQPGHQQPSQQQPGQQGQPGGGWGQSQQQGGGAYQQQSWGQRSQQQQQSGWHQQQGGQPGQPQWQPGDSGGGSKGPGGISKEKLPLIVGGGVVGLVVIGLLIFLGVRFLGGDDTPESNPTTTAQPTGGGSPTTGTNQNGELGNATGQAKAATDKLQSSGFGCSDLFNTGQGAHRGCFKYDGTTEAEAVFQFKPDGTIIAVRFKSANEDNLNNAKVVFDQVLQAVGNDTFGGDQVKKVQDAVTTGQKSQKVGSTWGEFELRNDGDSLELSGGKSGEDSLDLPQKTFDTTEAQLVAALKTKQYVCTSSCTKEIGKYGSQRVYMYASEGEGIKHIQVSASGDAGDAKKALTAGLNDTFGVLKGGDVAALKAYVQAHSDGKPYASYVAGWRVTISGTSSDSYSSQQVEIKYESFYV
ncbi:hypothetical protein ACWGID_28450 [Kribbella sp. NPDC054772]